MSGQSSQTQSARQMDIGEQSAATEASAELLGNGAAAQGQSDEVSAAVEKEKVSPLEALKKDGPTQSTIKAGMEFFGLSAEHAAHFFGQMSHESGGFKKFTENLNYSEKGLKATFPKYFGKGKASAADYARQPEKIANRVYGSRMGNGDEASGDGWKFRGRGAIQLTGRDNYQAFSKSIKDPEIMEKPELVADKYALESAKFYFDRRGIWAKCDKVNDATITTVSKLVNGGTNGLAERIKLTKQYYGWLGGKVETPKAKTKK